MPRKRNVSEGTSLMESGRRTPRLESGGPAPSASESPTSDGKWRYAKQSSTPGKVCRDCDPNGAGRVRPAPHPGPRCASHHIAEKRRRRLAAKTRHVERTYGLTAEQYDALYAFQGGRCAICRVATGTGKKRLAVDHDHHQAMLDGHDPDKGCPSCVRSLLCAPCNDVLAHARSMPGFFARGLAYLEEWPTRRMAAGGTWPPPGAGV